MTGFPVDSLRRRFPALALEHGGQPIAFLDGPGGTQVPDTVIEAVADYYRTANANSGGAFPTSERSDEISHEAHVAMADLLGASAPDEIAFGANMTSLTFHVSRSILATFADGDELVVTGLDHEANVGPWRAAAADRGIRVRTWEPHLDDCTLHLDDLDPLLNQRTRLVAVGWASNAVGTINPLAAVVERAHAVGAWTYVDAVASVPHVATDVVALGTDFLACSPYKFFGPHAGVLYGRKALLDRIPAYKVRPAHHRFETGTPSFEAQAGTLAAVDYLADAGRAVEPGAVDRRAALRAAFDVIRAYEMELYRRLADGLDQLPGVRVHGIVDRARFDRRTPTAALTIDGIAPRAVAERLGRDGIATWDGDFYATGLIERLGRAPDGVLRLGLMHYNTAGEVDRVVDALAAIAAGAPGDAVRA